MTQLVPALKGRMGGMDYFMLSMKAGELIKLVKTPREIEGWKDLSLEEQYQREINIHRVKTQLAPYWASQSAHFFGSIIVAHAGFDIDFNQHFENIDNVTKNIPNLYQETLKNCGTLTLPGETILVPLDGQHRVKAIEFAITGVDGYGKPITGFAPNPKLTNEDVSVLLVSVNVQQARSIFTHVNRYAKQTSAGQNYITSDDDICAVLAREITNDIFTARLVKYKTNTLTTNDQYFTTLSAIYNCIYTLAKDEFPTKLDTTQLPSIEAQKLLKDKSFKIWEFLVSHIDDYKLVLKDKGENGDDKRTELRASGGSLLARPVAQECLFRVFLKLIANPSSLSYNEAAEKLNAIPWSVTNENVNELWQNVLWVGDEENGRMVTKNRGFATEYIYHLAGGKLTAEEQNNLLTRYKELFPEGQKPDSLPKLI